MVLVVIAILHINASTIQHSYVESERQNRLVKIMKTCGEYEDNT